MAMLFLCSAVSAADDTKPATDSKEKDKQAEPTKEEAADEKGSFLDRLKKELFEDLEDGSKNAKQKSDDDKLDRAAKGMRNAGEKLGGDKTDKDTRRIQEQVIRDLDDLIQQLQNPPSQRNNSGGGGGGSSSQKMSRAQMQKMSTSNSGAQKMDSRPMGAQAKQGAEQKQGGGQDKKVAEGSEERSDSERKASEEAARKKKLEMDVWGHLPPHLRDQLLNTYGERMLPKYSQMVKQFYEALSEQGDTGPRR